MNPTDDERPHAENSAGQPGAGPHGDEHPLDGLRIGDTERDQAITELREQYALGRLDQQEFEQRLSSAVTARTASDLRRLVADLPAVSRPVDWRPERQGADTGAGTATTRTGRRQRPGRMHRHGAPRPRHPGMLPMLPMVGALLLIALGGVFTLVPLLIGWVVFGVAMHRQPRFH